MSGYLLGFLLTYLASVAVFLGLLGIALYNWLFGGTPVWFYVLCVIGVALPFLAGGEITGRRMKQSMAKPWQGLVVILGISLLVGAAYVLMQGGAATVAAPGVLWASAWNELAGARDEEVITLLAQLLFGLLFHLGWKTGQKEIG